MGSLTRLLWKVLRPRCVTDIVNVVCAAYILWGLIGVSQPTRATSTDDSPTVTIDTSTSKGEFIQMLYPAAIALEKREGIPVERTLAQAALESAWGTSPLAEHNNFFGLKQRDDPLENGSVRKASPECDTSGCVLEESEFATFATVADGVNAYGNRWKQYMEWEGQSTELISANPDAAWDIVLKHYATDPNYAQKVDDHRKLLSKFISVPQAPSASRPALMIVAGHQIHPRHETGALGEADFNLLIANHLTRQLQEAGYGVIRPDLEHHRQATFNSWPHYLSYVKEQEQAGVQVLEIHGQGMGTNPIGNIGFKDDAFDRAIAAEFGWLQVDPSVYAVTKRGGTIIEAFDTRTLPVLDERGRQRKAEAIATQLTRAIEQYTQSL